jgi:hypothetical protein
MQHFSKNEQKFALSCCKNKCPFEDIVEKEKFSKVVVMPILDLDSQSLAPMLKFY